MSKTKYILGAFADPDEMLLGIDKLQEHNIAIYDVFTPIKSERTYYVLEELNVQPGVGYQVKVRNTSEL